MKIVYMGTPAIAKVCLEKLYAEGFDLAAVYTKPDTPKNRGMKMMAIPERKERVSSLAGKRILLVEDNEINMEIAEFYLTDHGATVEEAWNGREAVEKYAANPQKFDVILMDLMMPVMGGLEAARQIRTMELPEAKQVPIIPMTAQSSEESKEGCRAAGMNSHLTKPIEPDGLVQTILETTEHAFEK